MTTIYVASSWKNDQFLDLVHARLHKRGFETFDFRKGGRWWEHPDAAVEVDARYGRARSQSGNAAFERDLGGMRLCEACLAVLPAGESLMLEVGWFCGAGKPVVVWGRPRSPLNIMWLMVEEVDGGVLRLNDCLDGAIDQLVEIEL